MLEAEVRVARGATSLYLASVATLALNTGYFVVLTNLLSQRDVGVVSLLNVLVIGVSTAAAMAIPVAGSGLSATPPAVVRFLPALLSSGEGSAARRVFLVSLLACAFISVPLSALLASPQGGVYLAVAASWTTRFAALDAVFLSFGQVGAYSLIGAGRPGTAGAVVTVSAVARYLAAATLLLAGLGTAGVFLGFSAGDALLLALSISLASRRIRGGGPSRFDGRAVSLYMLFVLLSGLIGFGVGQSDRLLAFLQRGLGDLAVYNVAAVGAAVAAFAPLAVTNVLVPALSSIGGPGERKRALMRQYTRYVSMTALPMGFGLAAISPVLLLVFGERYVQGDVLVAVMAVAVALTSVSAVYSSCLLAGGRTHLFLAGNVIALAALVATSYLLVPSVGLLGVAVGRAAMLFAGLVAFAIFSIPLGGLVLDRAGYAKSLLSSVAMSAVVYCAVAFVAPRLASRLEAVLFSLVLIPAGVVVYAAAMRAVRAFSREDFDFMEMLLPRPLHPVLRMMRDLLL